MDIPGLDRQGLQDIHDLPDVRTLAAAPMVVIAAKNRCGQLWLGSGATEADAIAQLHERLFRRAAILDAIRNAYRSPVRCAA